VDTPVAEVIRVAPGRHWHALEDDLVVGRGHALHRADGRRLISVDTWRDDVFAVLARAIVADLGSPVHTVVDDDDREVLGRWASVGFRDHRREDVLAVPTTDSGAAWPPGFTYRKASDLMGDDVRSLDQQLRRLAPGCENWVNEPGQFQELALDPRFTEPEGFLVAKHGDELAGLVRVAKAGRRPRLVLVGTLEPYRGTGLARALLNTAFERLRARGVTHVTADVDETDTATRKLLDTLGAERIAGTVELVR
jgi:GNAT superfamily N-acetyltransferase